MNNAKTLNIKYASIQGLYYIVICCVLGYAAVYLGAIGFSATWIGILLAIGNIITTILAPMLAGYVDKYHLSLNKVLIVLAGLSTVLSVLLAIFTKIPFIIAVLFVIMFGLLNCMMPLINALTFAFEEHGIKLNYGIGRGIGSAAYALTSLALGYLVKVFSPALMPIAYVIILAGLIPLLSSFKLKKAGISKGHNEPVHATSFKDFFTKYTTFMLFLLGFVLVYADHMIINNFFIKIVENIGADVSVMGIAVFLAAILELISMSAYEKWKDHLDIAFVIKFSVVMFTIKHIITWLAPNVFVLYIAQITQMFAYALFIPASVYYVEKLFNKNDAVKGQSLVTASMTVAAVAASLCGGFLLDSLGTDMTLLIGAIVSVIGTIIMLFTTQKV